MDKLNKRDRAQQFRARLKSAMAQQQATQSGLARQIGVDRSTISQLLNGSGARLPNAQVVGECAAALNVSADWLLSLSDRPENTADLLAGSIAMTPATRTMIDEQVFNWHREAAGYKIRHVPATMPDILKTDAMLAWEYAHHLGRTSQQAIDDSTNRLNLMRQSTSDYEIALPVHEIESFARGHGYYHDIPDALKRQQIDHLLTLIEQFYPRVRLYLFDGHRLFSAPMTIFGPLLAVVYIGQNHIAFRDRERIQAFTQHFDTLIREA
ncbi:MAG: helix-turn-helix transcriptional regulator, partial [Rhodospirillaceae bacterium]